MRICIAAGGARGSIVLPYGARMTPLAADWVRHKKISVGYGPDELVKQSNGEKPVKAIGGEIGGPTLAAQASAGGYLWWCDGPCGAAKAAVGMLAKESSLSAVDQPADAKLLVPVLKRIAGDVKANKAAGAMLLVQSSAAAVVLANRNAALRAIVGTTLESLEAGIAQVAANVLILEYPRKSFSEIRNLMSRFMRARRELPEAMAKQIQELASCV